MSGFTLAEEASTPATPSAGTASFYFKAGQLYWLEDDGTEHQILGDGGTPTFDTVTITTGTITDSTPAISITQTWNDAADTFVLDYRNVTDTNSAAGSLLAQWQVGGSDMLTASKAGLLTVRSLLVNKETNASSIVIGSNDVDNWESDLFFEGSNSAINWRISANRVVGGALTFTPSTAAGGDTYTTPALTIDGSNGAVFIGTTAAISGAATGALNVATASSTAPPAVFGATNASYGGNGFMMGCNRVGSASYYLSSGFYGNGSGNCFSTLVYYLKGDGGIGNIQANDVNLSDLTVKKDFENFYKSGMHVNAWQFVKDMRGAWGRFKYVDQEHADFNNGYGAQLVHAAAEKNGFSELVECAPWGEDKDGNTVMRWQVYGSDLMHVVGVTVTEALHEIDDLKIRVSALEAAIIH